MDLTKYFAEYVEENTEQFEEFLSHLPEDSEVTFSRNSEGTIYVYASGRL